LKVHPDLPDLNLSPDVIRRVQGRLLGLFGGVTAAGLKSYVPKTVAKQPGHLEQNNPIKKNITNKKKKSTS
jgi:hypothetical protein